MTELVDRLPAQFFTGILRAAAEARAQPGDRFIDLGRGNPDLPPPPEAIEAVREAMLHVADPTVHGYPPFQGEPALRAAIVLQCRVRKRPRWNARRPPPARLISFGPLGGLLGPNLRRCPDHGRSLARI